MDRNYLKGREGDRINAILAAAGFNFKQIANWLRGERPSLALLSISPRQQLVDLIDLVIGDAAEDIRQLCLRINTIELRGLDQRIGNSSRLATPVRAHKEKILAPESYAAHATLGSIVVNAETPIVEIGSQSFKADQAITDGAAEC